jgi:hypothetical protein
VRDRAGTTAKLANELLFLVDWKISKRRLLMSATEFPVPGPGAGVNSQIEVNRAQPLLLRNSRLLIGATLIMSLLAAVIAICLLLLAMSLLFPLSELTIDRAWSASLWVLYAAISGCSCPWLWSLGRAMAGYRVRLDSHGVEFNLGTKKKPSDLFLAWDQISAIKHRRVGNAQQYLVQGTDGSEAIFSSYTFFRPRKVARLIAARTGLAIQKA